jgi:wyosine [tRNA(Phe)-imidazoG37] synthetase (radical SAM superfamily)
MTPGSCRHIYGPVPSRRLGRSLGIDPVPFKTCTYDCIYCQLGRTTNKTVERKESVAIKDILAELDRKLVTNPALDFITIAGSGEPTLNLRIGDLIGGIKDRTRTPVAVLTNGSLLWMPEVREALAGADLVIPSLDGGDEALFRHVNRPHPDISFEPMVQGIAQFKAQFRGTVWLEVFLLAGATGIPSEVEKIAALVGRIRPERVQLNTVCRPPAEEYACGVDAGQLARLGKLIPGPVEVIRGNESVGGSGVPSQEKTDGEIVALVTRRPSTLHDVCCGLGLNPADAAKRLNALIEDGTVRVARRDPVVFYLGAKSG